MHYKKSHIQSVGKIHKVLFDYPVGTGIGTSTIAQDGDCACFRILLPKVFVPDSLDIVADKLGCIVTDSHCHISYIPCDIIDAVRNHRAISEGCKVVIKGFKSANRESLAVPFEVAEKFFLLGVNTEDRNTDLLQGFACGRNVFKLFIPILDISHGDILAKGSLFKSKEIKYLCNMISGYHISGLDKFVLNLSLVQRDPDYILILRKTSSMRLYDLNCCLNPFRMLGQHSMTSSALSADAILSEELSGMQFLQSILKSMCANSHLFAKFAVTESLRPEAFCSRGKKQSSVSFIQTGHIRHFAWREYFWRSFRMHLYALWLLYKDTKLSLDLPYYIIDDQIIKPIFFTLLREHIEVPYELNFIGQNHYLMVA